jgi:hypothetical protein
VKDGETEQALFQDRIASVPEREREAEPLFVIGEPGETVARERAWSWLK